VNDFEKFRGIKFREFGKKPRNRETFFPRNFLPLKQIVSLIVFDCMNYDRHEVNVILRYIIW